MSEVSGIFHPETFSKGEPLNEVKSSYLIRNRAQSPEISDSVLIKDTGMIGKDS
jgi:hypothetical protein